MIFGNPRSFAIEAMVEPGPDHPPVWGRNVAGRLCVWIGGHRIGRLQEPACWLRAPCDHLLAMCDRLQTLWEASFDGLSADEIFDRLDCLCFAAHRGQPLDENWTRNESAQVAEEARGYDRFVFLLHSSEAFDGWKAFLIQPTSETLRVLFAQEPQRAVETNDFTVAVFRDAVAAFASWLAAQERLLLPSE
jgi:hypothetical protein